MRVTFRSFVVLCLALSVLSHAAVGQGLAVRLPYPPRMTDLREAFAALGLSESQNRVLDQELVSLARAMRAPIPEYRGKIGPINDRAYSSMKSMRWTAQERVAYGESSKLRHEAVEKVLAAVDQFQVSEFAEVLSALQLELLPMATNRIKRMYLRRCFAGFSEAAIVDPIWLFLGEGPASAMLDGNARRAIAIQLREHDRVLTSKMNSLYRTTERLRLELSTVLNPVDASQLLDPELAPERESLIRSALNEERRYMSYCDEVAQDCARVLEEPLRSEFLEVWRAAKSPVVGRLRLEDDLSSLNVIHRAILDRVDVANECRVHIIAAIEANRDFLERIESARGRFTRQRAIRQFVSHDDMAQHRAEMWVIRIERLRQVEDLLRGAVDACGAGDEQSVAASELADRIAEIIAERLEEQGDDSLSKWPEFESIRGMR